MLFIALWHLILNADPSLIHTVTEMSNYNGQIIKIKIYVRRIGPECIKQSGGRQGSGNKGELYHTKAE